MVYKKRPLLTGRMGHGALIVNQYIYVVGGLTSLSEVDHGQEYPSPERTCERFDTITNEWAPIAEQTVNGAAKASPALVAV